MFIVHKGVAVKALVFVLLIATALAGVVSLAEPSVCPIAFVLGLVFLLLAARQSRKDRG